jgi:hypothetical protein
VTETEDHMKNRQEAHEGGGGARELDISTLGARDRRELMEVSQVFKAH